MASLVSAGRGRQHDGLDQHASAAADSGLIVDRVFVTMARDDESLPRLIAAVRRRMWAVEELQRLWHASRVRFGW